MTGMRATLRTLRWAMWLGWQVESNWTDPWLFAVYVIAKPLGGALLLVFMFRAAGAATAGGYRPGLLASAYAGNALFIVISSVAFGMSAAVVTDREHYGMLKYLRISPIALQVYLVGRGLSYGLRGAGGGLITLAAGILLPLGLREAFLGHPVEWGWLALYLAIGLVMLLSLGLLLSGLVLNMARHGMFLSDGLGSALYLLSGAIFPLDQLPGWLRPVGMALPTTYWLEGVRRAVLGAGAVSVGWADWGYGDIALALAAGTAVLAVLAQWVFRRSERRAWQRGRYDLTTGF
jgi:ABC-2 type transport system permease protein